MQVFSASIHLGFQDGQQKTAFQLYCTHCESFRWAAARFSLYNGSSGSMLTAVS